ncbi:MAG: nitrilase [Calditrichia bacterium]
MTFRVGFFQFRPRFGKVEYNRKKIVSSLEGIKADLIVLPELPFTGYNFGSREELAPLAEDPNDSPTVHELIRLCKRGDFYIVTGFAEKSGDQIYNSALLIGPKGLLHVYRKIHLFMYEKMIFTPGNIPLQVQNIRKAKIGIMICFDWIFPETMRILALQGADIICHPSNLVLNYCQQTMLSRCLENGVFAITTNRYGEEARGDYKLRFTGQSQIVAPRGRLIYRAKVRKEELFLTDIDLSLARDKKITEMNNLLRDRKPEFYQDLCR